MSGINFQWNDSVYFYILWNLKKKFFKSIIFLLHVLQIKAYMKWCPYYYWNAANDFIMFSQPVVCLQSMVKKATPGRSSPVKSVSRRNTPQRGTRRSTRASKQSESSDVDDVPNDSPVTIATDHKSTENKSAKRGRNFSPVPDSKRQRVSSGNESVSDDKETDKQVCGVGFGKLWSMFCLYLGFYVIL